MWDEALMRYDLGGTHPMDPGRLEFTMALARDLGVLDRDSVQIVAPQPASDETLALVHDPAYIAVVRGASEERCADVLERYGLGGQDNPVFEGCTRPRRWSPAVRWAARGWRGEATHAVNLAGGLHHAMPAKASGFCVYNDAAVAIAWLLADGDERVAYVDVDAHHGDGVRRPSTTTPGCSPSACTRRGQTPSRAPASPPTPAGRGAEGTAVNVALPPGTRDAGWLRAFHAVVPPLVAGFAAGDAGHPARLRHHIGGPAGRSSKLTVDGAAACYASLHELAHEMCDGRWLAVGGGGYAIVEVVPRSWTHLLAEICGAPLDPATATPAEPGVTWSAAGWRAGCAHGHE